MNGSFSAPTGFGQPGRPVPLVTDQPPPEPRPTPGAFARPITPAEVRARADRVQLAGGALNNVLSDEAATTPFEQLFRRLPEEGIHNPLNSPTRPFIFECGAFQVPPQQMLILFDLRPDIYRFQGVDPNDALPVEARRFGTAVGWEITIDKNHPGNTRFELEPVQRQDGLEYALGKDAINNPGAVPTAAAFVQQRRNRFGATSGAGLSLMPQRPFRFGPSSLPLTLTVRENQVFAIRAVVFKPIASPIACFEFDMAGLLVGANLGQGLFDMMRLQGVGGG